jgi:hypothetical protein
VALNFAKNVLFVIIVSKLAEDEKEFDFDRGIQA